MKLSLFFVTSVFLISCQFLQHVLPSSLAEYSNAIVIDAVPQDESPRFNSHAITSRHKRQLVYYYPWTTFHYYPIHVPVAVAPIATQPQPRPQQPVSSAASEAVFREEIPECMTKNGLPGICTSFKECYPSLYFRDILDDENIASDLAKEIYNQSLHPNCSSMIFAGTSQFGRVCCTTLKHSTRIGTMSDYADQQHYNKNRFPVMTIRPPSASQITKVLNSRCGKQKVLNIKIVGGQNTAPGEYPWMAVLYAPSGKHTCSASLIDNQFLVTAAHCIYKFGPNEVRRLRVHLGDYNIRTSTELPHVVRKVARVIKHKFFDINTFINDIALLKLDQPVDFTEYIQPICLASNNAWMNQRYATVAGWGRTQERGQASPTMLKVEVPFWTNQNCNNAYQGIAPKGIVNSMVCAGSTGKDSCVGDSGGPLMIKTDSNWIQVGVVSFGKGCGTHPGVYTRVDSFYSWIQKNRI